jgi:transposase-like protein
VKQHISPFKWRHFEPTLILLCVRRYRRCSLSHRDLEEMIRGRGLSIDHNDFVNPAPLGRLKPDLDAVRVE